MTDELLRLTIVTGPPTSISLEGELDFSNAKTLRRALDSIPKSPDIIFDLSGLEFIDSSGLTILANYARQVLPEGRVTVVVPRHSMRRLFTITALDSVLTVVEHLPG